EPLKLADRQVLKYQIFTHGEKPPRIAHSQLLSENDKSPQTAKTCRSASFEISDFHTWRKTA
ncbi:hypothetical protein ACPC5Q_17220, partial [Acinetobacter junii]|uniref:hypothetical protein n=1 Tax=Acinetobacter junii TaxID=40215 RepID=UPI003C2A5D01